jgi:cleavage and polyadenylation specificity factor subunit 2
MLNRIARQADALLISHADVQHLGAYPYARSHLGLSCPVFATIPVVNMGRMCMYDLHQAKVNEEEFDVFTLEDVDSAFDKITPLRYSQPTALQGKCKGITITAYSAAHTIGGTIWKIKKDTDEILYAVDYNHSRER